MSRNNQPDLAAASSAGQKNLTREVWVAGAVFVALFVGSLAFVVNFSGHLANKLTLTTEKRLVSQEFERLAQIALRDQRHFARWDEAIDAVAQPVDDDFVRSKISKRMWQDFGFSWTLFFNAEKNPDVALWRQTRVPPIETQGVAKLSRDLVSQIHSQLDRFKIEGPAGFQLPETVTSGESQLSAFAFRHINDQLHLIVAQPMVSPDRSFNTFENYPRVMVGILPVTAGAIRDIENRLRMTEFKISLNSPTDGKPAFAALPSSGVDTEAVATWKPIPPRYSILRSVAPIIAGIFVALIAAILIVGQRFSSTVTALMESEQRNGYLAAHDSLTGLANRAKFDRELDEAIAKSDNAPFSLMAIDLDYFKQVNDSHGHEAGDQVLQTLSTRFKNIIGEAGIVARVGGDEFMAIIYAINDRESLDFLGETLIEAACQPVEYKNMSLFVGASVGVVLVPKDGRTVADVTRHADEAMYISKDAGRGRVTFFESRATARRRAGDDSTDRSRAGDIADRAAS